MSNLLLIDSRVSDIDAILSSLTPNTDHIVFSYNDDTFDTLKTKINNTLTQYTQIAIAQHKYGISTYSLVADMQPGLLYELVDASQVGVADLEPQLESWQPFAEFITWLKTNVGMQYLDLLACDLWADSNWVYVINTLKQQCGISIRASIDVTGFGGDFILESDNVNLIGIYFTEKIADYKYSFVGNDFITLLNTKTPWGVYTASKYSSVTNKLYEIRNTGRDATVSGTLTAGKASGNGATSPIQYLNGGTTTSITWPSGSVPATHTVASITRYTNASANQLRVLGASTTNPNALYGHHNTKRGVAHINGWMTAISSVGTITNWVNMVVKIGGTTPGNVLRDTSSVGTATASTVTAGTMTINNHSGFTEYSEFGFSYLMIWDQALTDAEMVIVSNQLKFYLDTGYAPPVVSSFQTIMSRSRPWGIYRAVDWNSSTNTLPEARGITARNASKTNTGAVTFTSSTTGNGANGSIASISGTTTTDMTWPSGSLPTTYTLAFITRYTGTTYARILQAGTNNMVFGHWGNANRGVYYDKSAWINQTSYGTLTNWLAMVCKVGASPNNAIVDGVSRGTATSTVLSAADQLMINAGNSGGEDSTWDFSYLIVWDQALSDGEAAVVSTELLSYLGTGNIPETNGYVLNGYFTTPALSNDSYSVYTSPFAAIVNWTISTSNANIYIANNSGAWNINGTLPSGITQVLVHQYFSTSGSSTVTQQISLDFIGTYELTYYTKTRTSYTSNVITLGASIAGASQSSLVSATTTWELRTLTFTVNSTGTQTLTFSTSYSGGSTDCAIFLTAVNIQPIQIASLPPSAPTLNSVTAGNQQLSVAFTAPASNGSAITTYKYSLNGGALVNASTTTSPFTITGLDINTAYSVYIVATNAIGDSSNSTTLSATTYNYPGAPTISSVTGGNKQISIAFSAPGSNGGSAITTYKYSLNNGAFVNASTTTSPIVVTSLSDNTTYSVVLRATNVVGDSSNSNTVSGTTWSVPDAPTIASITEGNQQLSVAFSAPASNGGSAITTYKYSLNSGAFVSAGTTLSPITITGLTGGTSYSVVLRATNIIGDSSSSDPLSGTPYGIPSKPTISVQSGSYSAIVTDVSGSDGGRTITSYKYSTNGNVYSITGSATLPFTINDLVPGEGYYVTVKSTNVAGDSAASDAVYVVAGTIPDPPIISHVESGVSQTLFVYYSIPYDGYSAIIDYKYSLNGGDYTNAGSTSYPLAITGLTNGETYTVKIKAVNIIGESAESNEVTEPLHLEPTQPTLDLAIPGNQSITLYFTEPEFDGFTPILYYMYSLDNGADISLNVHEPPYTISGLTNGTQYSVKMKSVNRIGGSLYSNTLYATPRTVPLPPTIISLTPLPKSIAVAFTPSMNDGGDAIINTKYSLNGQTYVASDVSYGQMLIPNLSEGITYHVTLASTNAAGDSNASDMSSIYLPYTYNYEKPLSIDTNGEVFVMTLRNELNNSTHYRYSYDGINWTSQSLPTGALTSYNPYNVKWTGNQFLISGNVASYGSNALLKSSDGVDFSISKTTTTNQLYDIETNLEYRNTITFPIDTTLVLGGTDADTVKIAFSNDAGTTWVPSTNSHLVFTRTANDAVWNGRQWIAVGEGIQPVFDSNNLFWTTMVQSGHTIATSEDGLSWTGRGKQIFTVRGNAIDWSKQTNLCVAVGDGSNNSLAYSYDGVYWIGVGKSLFESGKCVKCNGQIWVAGGGVETGAQKSLAYSFDGKIWFQPTQLDLFATSADSVEWNGSQWVVHGTDPTYSVATSADGIVWKMSNDTIDPAPFFNQTQYLKIDSNEVSESPDGNYWSTSQAIPNMSVLNKFAWNRSNEGMPYIQPISIALGEGNHTIAYSHDGIHWVGLGKYIFTTRGNKAVWNGQIWVAVGTGTHWCAYSYDGIAWEGIENTLFTEAYDVAWNGYVFVAVGEGNTRIAISANGLNWSAISNSTELFTLRATVIEWTGKSWIAYGSGNNTTAKSDELFATGWMPTNKRNMCITDASSVITTAFGTEITEAPGMMDFYSDFDYPEYPGHYMLDTDISTYALSYMDVGLQFELSNGQGYITAQHIIMIDAKQLVTLKSYLLSFGLPVGYNPAYDVLREWALIAFPGDNDWLTLWQNGPCDLLHRGYYHTIPDTIDDIFVQYVNLSENTTPYRIYMLALLSTFETNVRLNRIDMFYDNSDIISRYVRPVVTRDIVIHPNTVLPFYHTVGLLTDLCGNVLENNEIVSPPIVIMENFNYVEHYYKPISSTLHYTNNQLITSYGYDGNKLYVTTLDGKLLYMSNDELNGYMNFDNSMNVTNLPTIYTSCYNRNFVLLGGSGESIITYNTLQSSVPTWYPTNANTLFTAVYGLASNSGYGHVYTPNALYLNANEKLSVVTPKIANQHNITNTSITIDLNKTYFSK